MRSAAKALCAAVLMCAAMPAAHAQTPGANDFEGQVQRYLDTQASKHAAEGFTRDASIQDFVRPLRIEGGAIWAVNLRRGVTYRLFAVCDNDCSDVDLELYDARGGFIGRDVAVNDTPYVEVTPSAEGVHFARIWLAACESEPCYVGVRAFKR
ncbi:MAG: hypothetical protein GC189_07160 [Alphaproteobacteria bacterium]|nr:hypothetical protein [Alphaproteobacteria bacterium]